MVRLQSFGNAVRKIYAVLPADLDLRSSDCKWNYDGWKDSEELKIERRTTDQLRDHGRHSLCSFFVNSTRLAHMVLDLEELELQRRFVHGSATAAG